METNFGLPSEKASNVDYLPPTSTKLASIKWPQTDDRDKTRAPQPSGNTEDHSFTLFACNSFDTLSETGPYHRATSPLTPVAGGTANGGVDIALPNLKHDAESDLSLGDISPIKVEYNNTAAANKSGCLESGFTHDTPFQGQQWDQTEHYSHGVPTSNPFFVIRSSAAAFENCRYLLPCLRDVDICQVNMSAYSHIRHYKGHEADTLLASDLKIAIRRVEAAICAFGGSVNPKRNYQASSIFRFKGPSDARQQYEQLLPHRYYLSGSRISWAVEENPPVCIKEADKAEMSNSAPKKKSRRTFLSPLDSGSTSSPSPSVDDNSSKMKYRCKRCGQLKQNHNCPYRQFLQRSIGVMVYPAVNSFTAAEPGTIAPPLTKMNNFVSYDSDHGSSGEYTGTELASSSMHPSAVTPEALRTAVASFQSPQSSLSIQSDDATPLTAHTSNARDGAGENVSADTTGQSDSQLGKAIEIQTKRLPFVAAVTLRQEHYRAVSPKIDESTAFQYPAVPLTFAERKRVSDTLFHLCKEIPTMLGACASVLRVARENKDWDLAVAELLTQVVVGVYCTEGDTPLDGLQHYLLALGISC